MYIVVVEASIIVVVTYGIDKKIQEEIFGCYT